MRKTWPLYLLLLMPAFCMGKSRNLRLDSLRSPVQKSIAEKKTADTAFINSLNRLANEYTAQYPDSTIIYAQMAISNAQQIAYQKGTADALLVIATVYVSQGKYADAGKNLDEAISLYAPLGDLVGLSNCYKIYGNLYFQSSNYDKALSFLNKALAIKVKIHDLQGTARTYLSMGNVYDNLGYSTRALDYYFKALNINTQLNNTKAIASNYNNIGVVLQNMEIYPEALNYYNKALRTWKQRHSFGGIATAYLNIGEVLIAQQRYDEAIKYLTEAQQINQKQDDKDGISSGWNDLGVCYLYKNQTNKALAYLNQALKISIDNQLDYNRAACLTSLALFYNTTHNSAKAYDYAVQAKSLADKVGSTLLRSNSRLQLIKALGALNKYKEAFFEQADLDKMKVGAKKDESLQKFTSYSLEYNFAEKQKQQQLQQKANAQLYEQQSHGQLLLNAIFGIVLAAMLVILGVYYRQKLNQQKINAQLTEKNEEVIAQKADLDEQTLKLNELNSLKDRLISVLAHDLRSPLSTLRGMFSLLEDDSLSNEEFMEMLPAALKKLEYTSDFLDTLLFWVNSQMANFGNSVKNFGIKELINSEMQNHKEQAALKGITLMENVSDDLQVFSDPNSIRIVTRNLITNALKFSSAGDVIEISADTQDKKVRIIVKDTGTGMSPKQKAKLFKTKVDSKVGTKSESGTGMGLLFCKDLVEKCNGEIWVNSIEGVGTSFYFTLPLANNVEAPVLA
ncbi:tetratricopeptide repeat protein [Mucilaginibacter flavus]|uniref:tetratricopeptide repeat protein n=1 Tax=Mucilaginibacter flavus TaxID=931504 RepID=UPI0025B391BB|nr:tetratricopeptide repeat protein [Mucilaginibacter flavus]MDN3579577.1 tetratricopeptide repeat protein [Mucilaginibacter flavus]